MATHRSQDTGFAPDFEFHIAIGVLEASEDLAARRRPLTPDALARQLCAQTFPARPTRTQIERGLAQVRFWRDHVLTRDILDHRAQLALLRTELHAQRRYLDDDLSCLNQMLREADAILRNTLAAPDGADALLAPASAGAARPLQ
jgi:hypothetical protein